MLEAILAAGKTSGTLSEVDTKALINAEGVGVKNTLKGYRVSDGTHMIDMVRHEGNGADWYLTDPLQLTKEKTEMPTATSTAATEEAKVSTEASVSTNGSVKVSASLSDAIKASADTFYSAEVSKAKASLSIALGVYTENQEVPMTVKGSLKMKKAGVELILRQSGADKRSIVTTDDEGKEVERFVDKAGFDALVSNVWVFTRFVALVDTATERKNLEKKSTSYLNRLCQTRTLTDEKDEKGHLIDKVDYTLSMKGVKDFVRILFSDASTIKFFAAISKVTDDAKRRSQAAQILSDVVRDIQDASYDHIELYGLKPKSSPSPTEKLSYLLGKVQSVKSKLNEEDAKLIDALLKEFSKTYKVELAE